MEQEPDPDDWGSPFTVHTGWDRRGFLRGARVVRTGAEWSGHAFLMSAAADSPIAVGNIPARAHTGRCRSGKKPTAWMVPAK